MEKVHIFISYAHADGSDFALKLYDDLEMRRINAWLDVYDINPGDDFYTSIDRGIHNAIAMIVVLTPGAILSSQVRSEWNKALNLHIPIIPLLVINCNVPNNLSVLNWIDFRHDYDPGIAALRRRITRLEQDHLVHLNDQLQSYHTAQKQSAEPISFQSKIDDLENSIIRWKALFTQNNVPLPLTRAVSNESASSGAEGAAADMRKVFVGRETELNQLNGYLQKMLAGEMQICFVAGDAGTGKSTLIAEFARHVYNSNPDLLYVMGQCNDITGMSDSYLPFRHVLGLLTGDESRRAAVEVNDKNKRLDGILKTTGRALVEIAPELVGTLIPGAGIIAALGRMGAKEKGMLKGLEEHAEQVEKHKLEIEQAQIFMQFTALLKAIAEEHPLVIVLDDLQWADMATVGLLFHLVRELKGSRILFVGLYRQGEIVSSRNDSTHPLKDALGKIFNEIKRYEADTVINLNKTTQTNGRAFVDAVVDAFPNKLDSAFRDALYQHTGGHALFTVELLAEMQDRGDLVLNDDENLIVSKNLSWDTLPARVEAIIEERIERLEEELRETLTVASVEGIDFTAQVVARVRELKERDLLKQLSQKLEKRRQLVHENGEIKIGKIILSRYTFNHALFHRYIYNSLGQGERRLLHGEVAQILEELYGDRKQEIVMQLSRHYIEAGEAEKAIEYLLLAADRALDVNGHAEAMKLLSQVTSLLEVTEVDNSTLTIRTQYLLGKSHSQSGEKSLAFDTFQKSLALARKAGNHSLILDILISLANLDLTKNNNVGAKKYLDEALAIARETSHRKNEAQVLRMLGRIERRTSRDTNAALDYYTQALEIAQEIVDLEGEAKTLNSIALLHGSLGRTNDQILCYRDAIELSRKSGNLSLEAMLLSNLAFAYRKILQIEDALTCDSKALEYAVRSGSPGAQMYRLNSLGRSYVLLNDYSKAKEYFLQSMRFADKVENTSLRTATRFNVARVHLFENEPHLALDLLTELRKIDINISSGDLPTLSVLEGLVFARLGRYSEALAAFTESIKLTTILLSQSPDEYDLKYTQALAFSGLALVDDKQADLIIQAQNAYKEALKTSKDKGIVRRELMELDVLIPLDKMGTIHAIRSVLESAIE